MQTSTTRRNSFCLLIGISIASLLSLSLADVQLNDNDVDANYMIVNFNQNEFPMAVGRCVPFNVLGQGGYQMGQCIDSNTLEYSTYSDSTCDTPTSTSILNTSTQTGDGTFLDFNCDGVDAYASIKWAVGTCDTNTRVISDVALSTCALLTGLGTDAPQDYTSVNWYCEQNYAELQYFDTPDAATADCSEDKWYKTVNVTNECGFFFKIGDTKLFGEIEECYGISVATTHMPSGMPSGMPSIVPSTVPSMMPSTIPTSMPVPGDNTGDSNKNCNIYHLLYYFIYVSLLVLYV